MQNHPDIPGPTDTPGPQERSDLAYAGHVRHFVEKARVSVQVHLTHLEKAGRDDPLSRGILPDLVRIEDHIENSIRAAMDSHPVWTQWASKQRRASPLLVGAVLSRCDITVLDTVSQMWAHLGFAPGQKRVKGEKMTFDAIGRTWCWRLGDYLLKTSPRFLAVYHARKEHAQARVLAAGGAIVPQKRGQEIAAPNMGALHLHNQALRYMIKVWLACAWLVWRAALGLPVPPPYPMAVMGHDVAHTYKPDDFTDTEEAPSE